MRRVAALLACCSVLLGSVGLCPAQGKQGTPAKEPKPADDAPRHPDPRDLESQLAGMRIELQRLQADGERLLDLRIRHELGLPVEGGIPFALQEAERALVGASGETLRDDEGRLHELSERLEQLQRRAESERTKGPQAHEPEPQARAERERSQPAARSGQHEARKPPAAEPTPARPGPERAQPAAGGGHQLLISGSTDRRAVGRILFKAGRFKEAKDELLEAVQQDPPELQDLFLLAQCWESLGDAAKADDLYKRIEALDTKDTAQGKVRGLWAEAARVASRQLNWNVENGQWKLPRTIESIDWRKSKR